MFFESTLKDKIKNSWLRINIQYAFVGLLIGTFLNIIFQLVSSDFRVWRNILMTYIVSVLITLCITNISILSSRITKWKFSSPFINILLNYLVFSIGVLLGTEISLLLATWVYDIPFAEVNHVRNLKFNFTIGFVAGTIIYLYQLQRDNYDHKIKEQELLLMKLNEMKTQADLKTLQARINPHFLYNSLNSITSLIKDEPEKAEAMTINLSKLFRYSINTQEANWATVKEELEMVNTYLDIERIRFGNRISFLTDADESVLEEKIPRFLLQPLVENALKHGLKDKTQGGILRVNIKEAGNQIEINVFDNGIPFPADLLVGYGLQSTIDKLNLLYGNDWRLNNNNTPEKKINIMLPKHGKQ